MRNGIPRLEGVRPRGRRDDRSSKSYDFSQLELVKTKRTPISVHTTEWSAFRNTDANGIASSQADHIVSENFGLYLNTFIGVQDPFWRDKVKKGQSATTNCSGTRLSYSLGFYSLRGASKSTLPNNHTSTFVEQWGYNHVSSTPPTIDVPSASVITDVTNRAIRKLVDRIDAARSSVESGQDFGEYHQSLRSFLRPVDSLKQYVLSYFPLVKKRTRGMRGHNIAKVVADTYLEWHFGWKPLAEDVADAYSGLTGNTHLDVVPVYASARMPFSSTVSAPASLATLGPVTAKYRTRMISEYSVRFKGAVRTGCSVSGLLPTEAVLQLDLPHFLPTVWDLVPYSFIADYFVNIGDIIKCWSCGTRNLAWVQRTTRTITRRVIDTYGEVQLPLSPNTVLTDTPGFGSHDEVIRTDFARLRIDDPGTIRPSLEFHLPTSPWPYINLGALLLSGGLPLQSQLLKAYRS